MSLKNICSLAFVVLAMSPAVFSFSIPAAEAQNNKTKEYRSGASNTQPKKKKNTGINRTLSPDLKCGKTESSNNVTKGAVTGAGAGLVVGGPVGAVAGAGAGALTQQAQNKDACGKK
jgi:hypothetical protein